MGWRARWGRGVKPFQQFQPSCPALFLAIPVIEAGGAKEHARCAHAPFAGIGVVPVVHGRIVCHEMVKQVGIAGVGELMRVAGRMEDHVAGSDGLEAIDSPHGAAAAEKEVAFPLGGVRVERAATFAGGEFGQFEIKGMAAEAGGGVALRAEGDGKLFACAAELTKKRF